MIVLDFIFTKFLTLVNIMFYTIRKIIKIILTAIYWFGTLIYTKIDKELEAIAEYLDGIKLAFAYQKNDRQFIYKIMYQKEKIKLGLWICICILFWWGAVKGYDKIQSIDLSETEEIKVDSVTLLPKATSKFTSLEKKVSDDFVIKFLLPHIAKWEGGWGHQKYDAGGETMCGITLGTYNQLCKQIYGFNPTKAHFLALNKAKAGEGLDPDMPDTKLFINEFRKMYRTDKINHPIIQIILTELYWGGNGAMLRLNNEIFKQYKVRFKFYKNNMNRLEDDFITWTNKLTIEEQNKFAHFLASSFIVVRSNIAARRKTQVKFLAGWNNRYHDMKNQIDLYSVYEVKENDENIETKFKGFTKYELFGLNQIDRIVKGQKLITKI